MFRRISIFLALALIVGLVVAIANAVTSPSSPGIPSGRDAGTGTELVVPSTMATEQEPAPGPDSAPTTMALAPSTERRFTLGAREAGSVSIIASGGTLTVLEARPNEGWTFEIQGAVGPEVEVDFRRPEQRITFNAEFQSDLIRIRVREREMQGLIPHQTSAFVLPAGSVGVVIHSGALELESLDLTPGWIREIDKQEHDRLRIRFSDPSSDASSELEARLRNGGLLEVRLEEIKRI